jgi:acetoin utilization deacetylase AcuC-like enzyme
VFNDAAVAIRAAQADGLLRRALIVDLDVHQGNGSAAIFAGDASVTTFSMHGAKNYPALRSPSDCDVDLPDGCGDAAYLDSLAAHLPRLIDAAEPDAVVYLAGADPYVGDRLGRLALSKPGLLERDRYVLRQCARHRLPLVVTMAGGYAEAVEDIVDIHFATVAAAAVHARERAREERVAVPAVGG